MGVKLKAVVKGTEGYLSIAAGEGGGDDRVGEGLPAEGPVAARRVGIDREGGVQKQHANL